MKKLTLSDETYKFLAANINDPEVRRDVDQVVSHNKSYEEFCGPQTDS